MVIMRYTLIKRTININDNSNKTENIKNKQNR